MKRNKLYTWICGMVIENISILSIGRFAEWYPNNPFFLYILGYFWHTLHNFGSGAAFLDVEWPWQVVHCGDKSPQEQRVTWLPLSFMAHSIFLACAKLITSNLARGWRQVPLLFYGLWMMPIESRKLAIIPSKETAWQIPSATADLFVVIHKQRFYETFLIVFVFLAVFCYALWYCLYVLFRLIY